MFIEITDNALDRITADYNYAFDMHKQALSKGHLDSSSYFLNYIDCIDRTMRNFGFVPVYNRAYDPANGIGILSGWHWIDEGEE